MALEDLTEAIETLQGMVDVHHDYLSRYETRTRQALIDPLLQALGWDIWDPDVVQIEYKLREERSERADYGLMWDNKPIAVVEAKHLGKSLRDKETQQANTYANENGIPYIIVTDGDRWEMYEVFKPVALEERLLMEFQLSKQPSHECVLQALRIWKPNLASGSPKKAMEPTLAPLDKIEGAPAASPIPNTAVELKLDETWIKKKISGFTFDGKPYKVKKWNEFLIKFCEILSEDDTVQFEDVLQHMAHSFSRNPSVDFCRTANPKLIGSTGISVYTNMDNDRKKELLKKLVEHFGGEVPVPYIDKDE